MSEIVQVISTVGFPIFGCCALFWQMDKMNEQHKEEIQKMVDAINNNTIALTKLTEKEND